MGDISNIKNITIVGAGTMGCEIAGVALMAGFEKVIINDVDMGVINEAAEKIENYLTSLISEDKFKFLIDDFQDLKRRFGSKGLSNVLNNPIFVGKLAEGSSVEELMGRLVKERDLKIAVSDADFVIEAVSEVMKVKQDVLNIIGEFSPPHAIIATNSSSLSITKIAEHSGRPEKVIGVHFFSPTHIASLIEITKGELSSDESIDIGVAVGKRFPCLRGKRFIVKLEKESPGFIANRLTATGALYISWSVDQAFEKKISWERLDADVIGFNSIGILEIFDLVGLDVAYDVQKHLESALSPDFAPGKILTKLVEEGNLGKKTGKGFYEWNEDGTPKKEFDNPQPAGLINLETLMAIQLNEGCRILEEGIVKDYKIIDKAMMEGSGSPGPFTSGKRKYREWTQLLTDLVETSGIKYFTPCELMKSGGFLKYH